ncbi:MAG: hypothetical protein KQI62_04415 [Deltaproteobacteria bacterium]|nr:hypothetical protein [Deltaproteobacteria bacterium]
MARLVGYLTLGLSLGLAALLLLSPGWDWWGLMLPAAGLVAGLWVLAKGYVSRRGFVVSPRWASVFTDVMFSLAVTAGCYALWEYMLAGMLGVRPLLDEGVQVVMSWMLLPSAAFMAFFAANMAGQSLEVNTKGLTWHGPSDSRFATWEQITGFKLHDSYVAVGRVGMAVPSRLQTELVIQVPDDDIYLYEPGPNRTKRALVAALLHHAPPRLRSDLERVRLEW